MNRATLPMAAAIAGTLVIVASSCTRSGPEAISDPRPTTTAASSPAASPGADDVVWQELTAGGFAPQEFATAVVPSVTIYGDGRIFVVVHGSDGQVGPPVALDEGRVSKADLDAFLADAEASGLFEPGTDFGSPGVTDQPSTAVSLRTDGTPRQVDVYALGFGYDAPTGDVTTQQAARRDQLLALLARARKLADHATRYTPERVRATMLDPGLTGEPSTTGAAWPGPPRSSFPPVDETTRQSCLVIEGDDAAAVYRATAQNPDLAWSLDGEVRTIAVVPLLPGQEGCPPS